MYHISAFLFTLLGVSSATGGAAVLINYLRNSYLGRWCAVLRFGLDQSYQRRAEARGRSRNEESQFEQITILVDVLVDEHLRMEQTLQIKGDKDPAIQHQRWDPGRGRIAGQNAGH